MTEDVENEAPRSLKSLFMGPTHKCQRCGDSVYHVEKVGPVNGVLFHKQCFKCCACNQHLTQRTYYTNREDIKDKEIYCSKDVPKGGVAGLDAQAMGIRRALNAPKPHQPVNEQILSHQAPRADAQAMYIKHPLAAQSQYQRKYRQQHEKHHFPAYLVTRKKEEIYEAQGELEKQQRQEEDVLMSAFMKERTQEKEIIKQEIDTEWERQLEELTERFDREMAKKGKPRDKKTMTVMFENEKDELKKNMTVKMQKKKEAMTLRLQKKEQQETSSLVKKHSQQMLEMLRIKQEQAKAELEKELKHKQQNGDADDSGEHSQDESVDSAVAMEEALMALGLPTELPNPHPPTCRKRDLYIDPSVFQELDEDVFRVAEREQSSFTELVKELTINCFSDLQKARAIFRWITVKDLNVMEFDECTDTESPMGLLRGIKYGTETYHTLFMRLCSYAGLACVEIKGHSKSVGYEPGMKIREDTFQNTWNAVLIDGDWWPVQCNWGARHLVLNKDVQEKSHRHKKQDKIRYQYDEHYFLTDPDEFIQEFWASEENWQLLEKHNTLDEFEAMPFVRSVFFHYGLEFERNMKAVLTTDNKGGTEVKIRLPEEFASDLVFHYQIRFADKERRNDTEFRGAKLERFVFHSLVDGYALFSVHVPTAADYFLEIFANKINETNKIGDDPNATMMPFRLKCACKFKVVCLELVGKMHPLPNCASGEWGPSKGVRHFGIKPLTHHTGVVSVDDETEVRFNLPRALHFLAKLRMNGVEDHLLEKCVPHTIHDNILSVRVRPPQPGQYGLDLYARPEDATDNHTLAHACKYLINCVRVSDPIDLPVSKVDASSKMSKDKWGPSPQFDTLGLKALTHKDPTIEKSDNTHLIVEIGLSEPLKLSYHLIREPDEDLREKVAMKENGKKAKFTLSLTKNGNYLFAIYARRKKDSENDMQNVYNYMIRYTGGEDSTLNRKKKGLFKK